MNNIRLMLGILSMFLLTSCTDDLNPLASLNSLIDALEVAPQSWSAAINNTISELEGSTSRLSKQVASDLRSIEQEAFTLTACTLVFTGTYIRLEAMRIRLQQWPDLNPEPPVYTPQICTTDPQNIVTGNDVSVSYVGFFFTRYQGELTGAIENEKGEVLYTLAIAVATDYRLTVSLDGVSWGRLNNHQTTKLVLKWTGGRSEHFAQPSSWVVSNNTYPHSAAGGSGGSLGTFRCLPNEVMVGINGRSDGWLDAIRFECAEFSPDTSVEVISPSGAYESPIFGGNGGNTFGDRCGWNQIITQVDGMADKFIDKIRFGCSGWRDMRLGNVTSLTPYWGGTGGVNSFNQHCKAGYVVTGVHVKADTAVDSLQFICSEIIEVFDPI